MAKKPFAKPIQVLKQVTEPPKREMVLDIDALLTEEEKRIIRQRAMTKIEARDKEAATEQYLREEMARIDRLAHPELEEPIVKGVQIDLALFADAIRLDGKLYIHGEIYDVPQSVYAVIKDIEFQTKRHEYEIHRGSDADNFYRRSREYALSIQTGQATSAGRPVRF